MRLWDFIVSFYCSDLIENKLAGERPRAYQTSLQVTPLESHLTVSDVPVWQERSFEFRFYL